jgi:hypothetical protein
MVHTSLSLQALAQACHNYEMYPFEPEDSLNDILQLSNSAPTTVFGQEIPIFNVAIRMASG